MNFGRAFSYAFEDPQWLQKIGIAALISIIPILGQIVVIGWVLEVTRRIINGEPDTLPDWSNFGEAAVRGLQAFVIGFVYFLPVILLSACSNGLLPLLANSNNNTTQAVAGAVSLLTVCISCFSFLYDLAAGILLPAAYGNFIATGQIGAAFRFGEIISLVRGSIGPYILVFLMSIVTGLIAALGLIACIIGVLVTIAYASTINAHLWGQAYKVAKSAGNMTPATPSMM